MSRSNPFHLLPSLPQGAEILIVRLRSLGDIVLSTPALRALHSWRPDLRLSVLVEPGYEPLLEGNPAVVEILPMQGFLATARLLRRRHFAAVFNQHGGPTSALLTAATGAPIRICWAGRQFPFLYNVLVPPPLQVFASRSVHTVEHRLSQFYWTGLPRGPLPCAEVFPPKGAVVGVARLLESRGVAAGAPYAVLRPGARYFTKRWAFENFVALARWLREAHGLEPIFHLGRGDEEIASSVGRPPPEEFVVLDSLNLRELIALIAGARLFVGNDSGPTHIASATGRQVVVIFGSSSSTWWRPWQVEYRVVQNDFPCNPCREDRCYAFNEPRCILSVTLDQVQRACEDLLAEGGARGQLSEAKGLRLWKLVKE